MKSKWVFELEVDETWVADGFNPTGEDIKELIRDYWLTNAYETEVSARIVQAPAKEYIDRLQNEGPQDLIA